MKSKDLKKQLTVAAVSVVMSAVALASATYAWFVTNSHVEATTSTVSAQANGMVLQIVEGDKPEHGGDTSTVASAKGHEISPSSTNDAKAWHVPATWSSTNVNTYQKVEVDPISGAYKLPNHTDTFYAYTLANYTLYTVNNTGTADVYLDGSEGAPITITKSKDATQEWFDKIKDSLRVGILIDNKLRVVYAPTKPSGHGNDVAFTEGWSCVDPSSLAKTVTPTYEKLYGNVLTNESGNWGATKEGGSYVKPTGNAQAIAQDVDYNGTNMKVVIWMEGTTEACQNMSGLETGMENPTFDVTLSLVGVVPDSK